MRLAFDVEANGLDDADTIWCICAKDIDTGNEYDWYADNHRLSEATMLIGHNIIDFDLPLLERLLNWRPNENTKIIDTLVMSRLAYPDRTRPPNYPGKGGPHSLEAWGYRVGKGKLDHEDWSVFSPDMLRRCQQDVAITDLVYHTLSDELKDFGDESVDIEHKIAKIMHDQKSRGIRFDKAKALEYIDDLSKRIEKIDNVVLPQLPKDIEVIGVPVKEPFLKTGGYKKVVLAYLNEAYGILRKDYNIVGGPFTRIKINDFDLGSVQKVKDYLLDNGWVPDTWNYSKKTGERTSPKLEGDFFGITGDIPTQVKKRIGLRHKKSQIEGWVRDSVEKDNISILHAGANPCGTPTGRMRHSVLVNMPKVDVDKSTGKLIWEVGLQRIQYGTQMRGLFIPREGYVIVGHDASGIELRMLAHYLKDPEFINEILSGDIHSFNQHKAGLSTRDQAKTFIYALIYGAGDARIGSIVDGDASDGAELKRKYFGEIPLLGKFINRVKRASSRGYLIGLDGRKLIMRRDDRGRVRQSRAPNTLLQGGAAAAIKKSCIILWEEVVKNNIEAYKIFDMHDEGQSEVKNDPKHIEPYCDIAVKSIISAGEYFNLNIPLDAEFKIGMSLAETH